VGRKPEGKVDAGRIGGWRRQHVGRLFLRASRSFAALATRKLKERGQEGLGYVERMADPQDARATLVAFTEEGWRFLEDAHHVEREIETGYAAVLGEERMGLLRSALEELLEHEEEKAGG
jgi:DNA-binding MarR family transcriptional regulator